MITYEQDGSVTFQDETDPSRTLVLPAGTSPADLETQAAAFFPKIVPVAPDGPTLSDWRVGLALWGRLDDVIARVNALATSTTPAQAIMGKIAKERLEYANTVSRSQLLQLKDLFGFTTDDVEESLWRASRVTLGDFSGVWPLH